MLRILKATLITLGLLVGFSHCATTDKSHTLLTNMKELSADEQVVVNQHIELMRYSSVFLTGLHSAMKGINIPPSVEKEILDLGYERTYIEAVSLLLLEHYTLAELTTINRFLASGAGKKFQGVWDFIDKKLEEKVRVVRPTFDKEMAKVVREYAESNPEYRSVMQKQAEIRWLAKELKEMEKTEKKE